MLYYQRNKAPLMMSQETTIFTENQQTSKQITVVQNHSNSITCRKWWLQNMQYLYKECSTG